MIALAEAEARLHALLQPLAPLWRASPFAGTDAGTCHDAFDDLDDAAVDRLGAAADEGRALRRRLGARIAAIGEIDAFLDELLGEMPVESPVPAIDSPHRRRDVGGRKLAQIDAFLQMVGPIERPLVDWCAGKGHLGRIAALRDGLPATCVERDAALCEGGEAIARRDGAPLDYLRADVMTIDLKRRFAGRHVLALHACGHLHRRLVREAAASGLDALDLAPCCHHRHADGEAEPTADGGRAKWTTDDRRLAVTGHATASAREWRRHRELLGWQCAQRALARRFWRLPGDHPLPAQRNGARAAASFEHWIASFVADAALAWPDTATLVAFEAEGHVEAARLLRRSLVRLGFQRPLEVALVLNLARALEAQGFSVRLRRFCDARLSPRNLLISARRIDTAFHRIESAAWRGRAETSGLFAETRHAGAAL